MAMIDYGAIVIHNGKVINKNKFFQDMEEAVGWSDKDRAHHAYGNFYAYVGDSNATACFYKHIANFTCIDGETFSCWGCYENKKAYRFNFHGMNVVLQEIVEGIRCAHISYKDEHYTIVYGYGIDSNFEVWNEIKVRYLGKERAKKIDRFFKRYLTVDEYRECINERYPTYRRKH